jgi:hypothetical protein
LVPKINALSIRPQDPLITSQATIAHPLPELPPPRRSGENASNLQVLRVAAGIIAETFPALCKASTTFFTICVTTFFKSFHKLLARRLQGFYKVVTRLSQCFYKYFTGMFLEGIW